MAVPGEGHEDVGDEEQADRQEIGGHKEAPTPFAVRPELVEWPFFTLGVEGRTVLRQARHERNTGWRVGYKSSGASSSFTCHGRTCRCSMSMKGSGSICSMLNTPSPFNVPVTIFTAPNI